MNIQQLTLYRQQHEDEMRECEETALRNRHTLNQAHACQNYSVGCPDCPFKLKEMETEQ